MSHEFITLSKVLVQQLRYLTRDAQTSFSSLLLTHFRNIKLLVEFLFFLLSWRPEVELRNLDLDFGGSLEEVNYFQERMFMFVLDLAVLAEVVILANHTFIARTTDGERIADIASDVVSLEIIFYLFFY